MNIPLSFYNRSVFQKLHEQINKTLSQVIDFENGLSGFILLLIFFIALFTNCAAFLAIFRVKTVCTNIHCILLSFLIADSLFVISAMPLTIVYTLYGFWPFSTQVWCYSFMGSKVIFAATSSCHVAAISIYRLLSVTHPYMVRNVLSEWPVGIFIFFMWSFPFLVWFAPLMLGLRVVDSDGVCHNSSAAWFRTYIVLLVVGLPSAVVLMVNGIIFQTLRRRGRFPHRLAPFIAGSCPRPIAGKCDDSSLLGSINPRGSG